MLQAGVEDLRPEDLRPEDAEVDWSPDLVVGGPPCQPFSSSGKMLSIEDPRGRLFEHFARLVKGLRSRLVLFENVRGLVTAVGPGGEPGEALHLVKKAFEDAGYATTFALLNAADYGAPQRRVRCFMMASRSAPLPAFPEPTHAERPSQNLFLPTLPWVTLGEFLASRPEPAPEDVVRPTAALAAELARVPVGSGLKSAGAREATRPGGHWGYRQGTFVADPRLPARTVTASSAQDWVRLDDGSLRRLTWRECAALQGFPEPWQFTGPLAAKFRQIGNAVPAVFGEALGRSLLAALEAGAGVPTSAPLPRDFTAAINYTRKEHKRNGASRREVIRRQQAGATDIRSLKGLGADKCA